MKKLFVILIVFLGLAVQAQDKAVVLKSETGVVESIKYEDNNMTGSSENVKQTVVVKVTSGKFKGIRREIDNILTGNPAYDINLSKGDRVILHAEPVSEFIATADDVNFFIADIKREVSLLGFAGIFCLLLVLIGRKKGIFALISIAVTAGLIFVLLVPMILNGFCPIASAVLVSVLSTLITIHLVGGWNIKSSSASLGVIFSLFIAAGFSMAVIYFANLTGFAGEEPLFLYAVRPDLDFKGILSASIIIAALGALMDTGISIASTINEIYETDNSLSVKQLFTSGMNVGKDIIGTMSNTLILVYLGASLPLALLSGSIDLNKFFNLNQVATEIASALAGSIGILACVPITAIITAYLIKKHAPADFDMYQTEQ
ncbi:MAG: YibE/F family protein [Heliobacteriaceae bacterium]|jgi:uncharacterized membrane protein|nr:YibE/F family protein [Heliobacteriaceae bacterium]